MAKFAVMQKMTHRWEYTFVTRAALTKDSCTAYATTIRLRCNNSLSNYKPKLQAYMRHVLIDLYSIRKASQSFAVQTESRTTAVVFSRLLGRRLHLHLHIAVRSKRATLHHARLAHTRLLLTAALGLGLSTREGALRWVRVNMM
jgi:hypothetical protein